MKNIFKFALVLSIGIASCQQDDNFVTPADKAEATASSLRENMLPTVPQKHQLIKHGNVKLAYYPDGKLQKVTYVAATRTSPATFATYKYNANYIIATVYYNNKVAQETTYLLDNYLRCYESIQKDYIPMGPNAYQVKESNFHYNYNSKGQLDSRINKKVPTQKTVFIWNAAGDLVKMTGYNFRSGQAYEPVQSETTLYYDQPTGDPILADLAPINSEAANLPDPYLMVFGKSSRHLVKMVTENTSLGGNYYAYALDAEGYVTKRDWYTVTDAKLIESTLYEYLISDLGFNL
ncbi:hypothetical protein [Dyadobacter pollutisoli]|uniref:DUF4595 domain-containing protein n=1 Tax=Dyadobacter pollutisoli TaxID=2910158 RepID=A0A9E8NGR1_9BACT|nr:hypothetical protein [Dyadobacter pollutisoli]WAC14661.1 hypothetical protein ON006_12005 [Dyadobacter pollutisoli]